MVEDSRDRQAGNRQPPRQQMKQTQGSCSLTRFGVSPTMGSEGVNVLLRPEINLLGHDQVINWMQ